VVNLETDRVIAKRLGLVLPISCGDWEEQVRLNLKRGFPGDWIDRKYVPPDWSKVYPSVGRPPVWSTESMQAYEDLINAMTELLEPRDQNELSWTKEAVDADWEARRLARRKNEWLKRNLNRGKYCQALDIAYTRALKRRDNALHRIAQWRRGLGAKVRALPDRFVDERLLAKRYGVGEGRTDGCESAADIATPGPSVVPAITPARHVAGASSLGSLDGTIEAAPKCEKADKCAQAAQCPEVTSPLVPAVDAMEARSTIIGLDSGRVAPGVASADKSADSSLMVPAMVTTAVVPLMVVASEVATNNAAPVASSEPTGEGTPRIVASVGAADVARNIAPPDAPLNHHGGVPVGQPGDTLSAGPDVATGNDDDLLRSAVSRPSTQIQPTLPV
jgi:hypothetical protein